MNVENVDKLESSLTPVVRFLNNQVGNIREYKKWEAGETKRLGHIPDIAVRDEMAAKYGIDDLRQEFAVLVSEVTKVLDATEPIPDEEEEE